MSPRGLTGLSSAPAFLGFGRPVVPAVPVVPPPSEGSPLSRPLLTLAAVAATALSAVAVSACGSSSTASAPPAAATVPATTAPATTAPDEDAPPATTPAPAPGTAARVGITLGKPSELSLVATPATVAAGTVTFAVRNRGAATHELVVVKTDKGQGALASGGGPADETGSVGESGDLQAGASTNLTLTLPKGRYVLLCNLPGHYAGGMHAAFTVR